MPSSVIVRVWFVLVVGVAWLAGARPAEAQMMAPWFNGAGFSIGGGPMAFRGGLDDPLIALIRPEDDSAGAVAIGAFLSLGRRRWALLLPEFQSLSGATEGEQVSGTLTLGSRSLAFEPNTRGFGAYAVLAGGQVALVPSGRVWVRGGIGSGWISSRIQAEDPDVGIDLSKGVGLALSAAAGVSVWQRPVGRNARASVDAEVHYLRIAGDDLRVSSPSFRVGLRIQADCFPGRCP